MDSAATHLAHRLARNAEAVCRHYLPNGRRVGRYWLVGDVDNTPGRSLYVRLTAPIYANLIDDEGGETASLIWSRPTGKRSD
jgi:uncharacterized protein (DUF736 family)